MNPSWERIAEAFDAALDLPPGERESYLARIGAEDPRLREEVERMLAAHERTDGLLERPPGWIFNEALEEAEDPLPGRPRVGPYQLLGRIGRGGMGVVYRAFDDRLGRLVALKFLPRSLGTDERAKSRFVNEARTASALDHPNICTIFDLGETEDGQLYIAMAYYDGGTLAERIARGPLGAEEAIEIALRVTEGLEQAHDAGIVHRDVKPSNLFLTRRGEVKILDFGVAKLGIEGGTTASGSRIGTVRYMSPEQARGEDVDARSDVWSLGIVLYEMLTGRHPFEGRSHTTSSSPLPTEAPPPPAPEISAELDRILRKALAPSPEDRYPDARRMGEDLKRARSGETKRAPRPPIPAPVTSFVGREQELEQIRRLFSVVRLVTILGAAGTGKTRLALEAGRRLAPEFEDGATFVSLETVGSADLVAPAIAQSLGIEDSVPVRERLVEALSSKNLLLILDNFEQVTGAAPVVGGILQRCPRVKVLVTSRVPLRVSGEHELPLAPLALPAPGASPGIDALAGYSAIALFVERARAVEPAFRLSDDNAESVQALCTRLDGIPLAIELAAARIKLFSPRAILDRLGSRLDLLKGGPRDRPARHQTLRGAIAWSYNLLDDAGKSWFRRLSVFVGGFSLEAAQSVCAAAEEEESLDALSALVDHNLIAKKEEPGGEPRFSILETIRAYGLERLEEEGEGDATRRAHARTFLALAERAEPELTRSDQVQWLDRLEREHENLRAALSWAEERGASEIAFRLGASLWRFWLARGFPGEARRHLERIKGMDAAGVPLDARARFLNGLGTIAQAQGDNLEARGYLEESLALWRRLDDRAGIASVLNGLAWVACELSDLRTAEELSREALALHRELGQKRGIALALNNLGWVAAYRGLDRQARSFHQQGLALRREIGYRRGIAFELANLAWAELGLGELDRAEELAAESLAVARQVNDKVLQGFAVQLRGQIASARGEYDRAGDRFEQSLRLWGEGGNRSGLAWVLSGWGACLRKQGDLERAAGLLAESRAIWRSIGGRWGEAAALYELGCCSEGRGRIAEAAGQVRQSLALRVSFGDHRGTAECLELAARLADSRSRSPAAARLREAAARLRQEEGGEPLAEAVELGLRELARIARGEESEGSGE